MGRSRLGWMLGAIAPWWLGAALAVSLPADAGQEAASGASLAPLALRPPAPPSELVPAQVLGPGGGFASLPGAFRPGSNNSLGGALRGPLDIWSAMPRILRQASLVISNSESLEQLPDEVEPRPDLKRNAGKFPAIDRSLKDGPAVGVLPTFDARLRRPGDSPICARVIYCSSTTKRGRSAASRRRKAILPARTASPPLRRGQTARRRRRRPHRAKLRPVNAPAP